MGPFIIEGVLLLEKIQYSSPLSLMMDFCTLSSRSPYMEQILKPFMTKEMERIAAAVEVVMDVLTDFRVTQVSSIKI